MADPECGPSIVLEPTVSASLHVTKLLSELLLEPSGKPPGRCEEEGAVGSRMSDQESS